MLDEGSKIHASGRAAALAQFEAWPTPLQAWFDGTDLARKTGFTASLITRNVDGRLGTSLLSLGELYAGDARTLCFALWARSRAAQALAQGGRAALTFVFDAAFYQVQLDVVACPSEAVDVAGLACFAGTIAAGEMQRVPYASLEHGITFLVGEDVRDAVLQRWATQIELLKGLR